MRTRTLPAACSGIAALVLATVLTSLASAHSTLLSPTHRIPASSEVHLRPAAGTSCYQQLANDNGQAVLSQKFERKYSYYDDRGADDFTLDSTCTVTHVLVDGVYALGPGPARSVHVTFYQDDQGTPGHVISGQDRLSYSDPAGTGSFDITLDSPVVLAPGHYWVSVKANQRFDTRGAWYWSTNNAIAGLPSQWRNVRDGFGTGCIVYTRTTYCVLNGEGGDFAFALIQ